ncbi:MAG: AAA family ATPase, partial [Puniceicoccales bacterium]
KTRSIKTLARVLQAGLGRIQFTPDLLPSDVTGSEIYHEHQGKSELRFQPGPIFNELILADEINRAPAKVQSALLEAMQERQVTLGDETFDLPKPFLVLATENPIDQEGTYPLPEAQVDRFMLKLKIGYPTRDEERGILERMASTAPKMEVNAVINPANILAAREVVDGIYVDDKVKDYIVDIVFATRKPSSYGLQMDHFVQFGGSPRATIALTLAAKAWAFLQGRGYITPQDVKSVGMDVLRHRAIPTYEAEAEDMTSEDIVAKIFETVPVP